MKCKNCGKELTGKKEFCDDNKGKCYREYKKKESFIFNEGKELPQMTCRGFVVDSEYDSLQLTLTQLKEENNQIKQSSESLIESFDEKLLAMTKGNVELRRKLKREKGEQFPLESDWKDKFNNMPTNQQSEIISLATSQLDSRENDYPKTQEYLLWEVKIPKILIEREMFLRADINNEKVNVDELKSTLTKLQEENSELKNYLDEEIVPSKTDEWKKGDGILQSVRTIYNLKSTAKNEINILTDKLHDLERAINDINHEKILMTKTRRELLKLDEDWLKLSSQRQGIKVLICAYESVDGISFTAESLRAKDYGNTYNYKTKCGNVNFGDKVGVIDELAVFIDELHKAPIGKLSTKKGIKKGDLADLKLKISEFPNAKSFRVVNNTLEVYN